MTHRQRDHPDKGAAVAGLRVHPTPPLPAGTSPNEPAAGLPVPRGTFSSAAAGADLLTGGALQPGQCHPSATADPATVRLNTQGAPPLTTRSAGAAWQALRAAHYRSGEIRVAPPPRPAARPDRPTDRPAPPQGPARPLTRRLTEKPAGARAPTQAGQTDGSAVVQTPGHPSRPRARDRQTTQTRTTTHSGMPFSLGASRATESMHTRVRCSGPVGGLVAGMVWGALSNRHHRAGGTCTCTEDHRASC